MSSGFQFVVFSNGPVVINGVHQPHEDPPQTKRNLEQIYPGVNFEDDTVTHTDDFWIDTTNVRIHPGATIRLGGNLKIMGDCDINSSAVVQGGSIVHSHNSGTVTGGYVSYSRVEHGGHVSGGTVNYSTIQGSVLNGTVSHSTSTGSAFGGAINYDTADGDFAINREFNADPHETRSNEQRRQLRASQATGVLQVTRVLQAALEIDHNLWPRVEAIANEELEQSSENDNATIKETKIERDGQICPICLDEFPIGKVVNALPCGHLFDQRCIVPWLEKKNCPMCRKSIRRI